MTLTLSLLVSLDSILQDVRALERGTEAARREFSVEKDNPVLQTFLSSNTELLRSLIADGKTAQVKQTSTHEGKCSMGLSVLTYFRSGDKGRLFLLSSRMCTTRPWSTLERTLKPLRPPSSSPCLSGSSKPTRSDNARLLRSQPLR